MSAQHTQGRLVAENRALFVPGGDGLVASTDHFTNGEADARRLAACWNACEGAETEAIENLAAAGGLVEAANGGAKVIVRLAATRQELATARADSRAIEANYEAARKLLEEVARDVLTECNYSSTEQAGIRSKVSAFLKGGA